MHTVIERMRPSAPEAQDIVRVVDHMEFEEAKGHMLSSLRMMQDTGLTGVVLLYEQDPVEVVRVAIVRKNGSFVIGRRTPNRNDRVVQRGSGDFLNLRVCP